MTRATQFGIGTAIALFLVLGAFLYQTQGETIIGVTLTSNPDLENGLVAHWTFDGEDMISNVADRSGNGNDGTIENQTSTTTITGPIGQGLGLSSGNDYVLFGNISSTIFSGDFTIAGWIKPGSTGANRLIFDKRSANGAGTGLLIQTDNTFAIVTDATGVASVTSLSVGEWYHIAATREGTSMKVWINGVSNNEVSSSADGSNTNFAAIGSRSFTSPSNFFDGSVDDFRVYDKALATSSMQRLYGLGATTRISETITSNLNLESGLVGHWTFDGGDMISNVADRSGQGNHGFLVGHTSTTTAIGRLGQALSFDGVDDYVNMGDNDGHTGMSAITISIWVYFQEFDSTNDEEGVIGKDRAGERAYGLFIGESDLKPLATFSDDGTNRDRIDFDTALTPNAWNHIVVTWDGSNIYAYNNGLPDGSQVTSQTTGTIFNSADNLRIGDLWDTDDRFFTGRLDDARIYNRALSDDEVSRLHGLGSSHTSSVTAELPKTFQETCWDDNGASRSCSGTGEDGEIRYGITPPSNRFIDNGDGTILDLYTQIIWLKDADCFGADLWQTALDNAAGLNTGECGLTDGSSAGDWNVPNLWQLSSLQDHEQSGPGLPSGHPFTNVFNGTYWTNSTRVSLPGWAVSYSMNNPHYDVNDKDVTTGRTWPMRLSGLEGEAPVRLPKSGQTSCWDDAGVSRSCSGTGEDGELQHGFSYPSPRFTDNGDGTVTDNYTSLVWLKNAGCFTGKLWQTALDDAAGLNTGECGLTDGSSAGDWILPNFYQIMSLVDFENESPSLPAGHPFTNVQAGCHTSTTRTSVVGASWAFVFNNGTFTPVDKDVDAGCAWPVKR